MSEPILTEDQRDALQGIAREVRDLALRLAPIDSAPIVVCSRREADRVRAIGERIGERVDARAALAHARHAVRHLLELRMHEQRRALGCHEHDLARPEVRRRARDHADVARARRTDEHDALHGLPERSRPESVRSRAESERSRPESGPSRAESERSRPESVRSRGAIERS